MDSQMTVADGLVVGLNALMQVANAVPNTSVAGLALATSILVEEVIGAIHEAADGSEEDVN